MVSAQRGRGEPLAPRAQAAEDRDECAAGGVKVAVLEPGPVSSGVLDRPRTYLAEGDPYRPIAAQLARARGTFITVEEFAAAIVGAVEHDDPPFRIPVGAPAMMVLAARSATPPDISFRIAPFEW